MYGVFVGDYVGWYSMDWGMGIRWVPGHGIRTNRAPSAREWEIVHANMRRSWIGHVIVLCAHIVLACMDDTKLLDDSIKLARTLRRYMPQIASNE